MGSARELMTTRRFNVHRRRAGYSGGLLSLLSGGFALGSWIAMLPILHMLPLMVRRTLIEERMLANALPGYTEYMRQVRFRIIPGVWRAPPPSSLRVPSQ
jgi:protein-S-isoprenylcysteine O-methyltransferase Ste14